MSKNPNIEVLFFSLSKIEEFSLCLKTVNIKENSLCKILLDYISNDKKNNGNKTILEQAETFIKNFYSKDAKMKSSSLNLNDFGFLIKIILKALHNELNTKISNENSKDKIQGYDKEFVFKKFREKYYNENNSPIMHLFFGVFEVISKYSCCKIEKYEFKEFKYLNLEIKEKNKKLSDFLKMLSPLPKKNQVCDMCGSKTAEIVEIDNFQIVPGILIINLNNIQQNKVNIDLDIKINDFKYFLYLFIYQEKKNIYKICYKKDGENWYISNDKKELNKITQKDLIKYTSSSKVVFYKNEKLLNKNNPIITTNSDENSSKNIYVNKIYNESDNPYFGDMKTPITQKANIEPNNNQNNFNQNQFLNPNQNIQQNNNFQNVNMINNNNTNNFQNPLLVNNCMNNMRSNSSINQMNNINSFPNNMVNCNNMNNNKFNNNFNNMNPNNFIINNMSNNMMNMNMNNNLFINNNMNMMMNNQKLINNNNFSNNMNINMGNNMIIQNNSNKNNMNQISINNNMNKNSNLNKIKGKDMTIFFKLKNDQQFYIDVDETEVFGDVINKLKEKNKGLKNINIKEYKLNKKKLTLKKTIKELGIKNNSLIDIIEKK